MTRVISSTPLVIFFRALNMRFNTAVAPWKIDQAYMASQAEEVPRARVSGSSACLPYIKHILLTGPLMTPCRLTVEFVYKRSLFIMTSVAEAFQTFCYELTPLRILVVVFICILVHLLRNKYSRGLSNLPGPKVAAYTSLWRWADVRGGQAHKTAISLHRKYGHIVRIGPNHVSISDPCEIKNIYGLKSGYTKVRTIQKMMA